MGRGGAGSVEADLLHGHQVLLLLPRIGNGVAFSQVDGLLEQIPRNGRQRHCHDQVHDVSLAMDIVIVAALLRVVGS